VIRFFPYLVAAGETGAALVYLYNHEWRLAIIWGGYAVAAVALASIK